MRLIVCACAISVCAAAAIGAPRVVVHRAAGPIRIDGDFSDRGWQGAAKLAPLVYQGTDCPYRFHLAAPAAVMASSTGTPRRSAP